MNDELRQFSLPVSLMVVTSTLALAAATGGLVIPGILIGLVLLHEIFDLKVPVKPRLIPMALLVVPYLLWWQAMEPVAPLRRIRFGFLLLIAMVLLTLAVAHILTRKHGGDISKSTAYALAALALVGCVSQPLVFMPALGVFALLLLWRLRLDMGLTWLRHQRGGTVALRMGIVVLTLGAAWLMHEFAVTRAPAINEYLVRQLYRGNPPPSAGFNKVTAIGSISSEWDISAENQVVLRAWADDAPGYLRGAVYDTYVWDRNHNVSRWKAIEEDIAIEPTGEAGTRNEFRLLGQASEAQGTIYTARQYQNVFFVPLNTNQIATYATGLRTGRGLTVAPAGTQRAAGGYTYGIRPQIMPGPIQADLQIPGRPGHNLKQTLSELTRSIITESAPRTVQISQLEAWFKENFQYRLGITIQPGRDPILQFLDERNRAGHCEYFASAATLMLRSVGIPARYVNGFICAEEGLGDVYLARKRNAHAWVEAWIDEERGWQIVEPTPPDFRPADTEVSDLQKYQEAAGGWWQRLKEMIVSGGIRAIWQMIWDGFLYAIRSIPIWGWLLIIAVLALISYRGALKRRQQRLDYGVGDDRARRLRRKLERAERLVRRHGVRRGRSMTVSQFIQHIRAADLPDEKRNPALTLLREYESARFARPDSAT